MKNIQLDQDIFIENTKDLLQTCLPFANSNTKINYLLVEACGIIYPASKLTPQDKINLIKELIARGADVNFQETTPYFEKPYLRGQGSALDKAVISGRIDAVELLLEYGAKPTPHILRQVIALSTFSGGTAYALLQIFLNFGIDLNQYDEDGTILHGIVFGINFANFLLSKGADPNATNDIGQTPLHLAIKYEQYERAKLLLQHGAKFDYKDKDGKTPLDTCISTGIYNDIMEYINNPNYVTSNEYKVYKGLDPNLDETLVESISRYGHDQDYYKIAKLLVDLGANLNTYDEYGNTSIIYAARYKDLNLLKLCLKYGADVRVTNPIGVNVLMEAVRNKDINLIKLLLDLKMLDINAKTIPQEEDPPLNALDWLIYYNEWQKEPNTSMKIAKLLIKNGLIIDETSWVHFIKAEEKQMLFDYQENIKNPTLNTESNIKEPESIQLNTLIKSAEDISIPILDNFAGTICSYVGDNQICNTLVQGCEDGLNSDVVLAATSVKAFSNNPIKAAKIIAGACIVGAVDAGVQEVRTYLSGDNNSSDDISTEDNCIIC